MAPQLADEPRLRLHAHSVAAFLLPLCFAVWANSGDSLWRSDGADWRGALRPQQMSLSQLLQACLQTLPAGNQQFRAGLLGAFLAGGCSLLSLRLATRLFRSQGGQSRIDSALALAAALALGLSFPLQSEASIVSSVPLATFLSLWIVQQLSNRACGFPNRATALVSGLALGLLSLESLWCTGVLALALLSRELTSQRAERPRVNSYWCLGAAASVGLLLWVPRLLSLAPGDIEAGKNPLVSYFPWSPLDWVHHLGALWCLGAIVAVLVGTRHRGLLLVPLVVIFCDILAPGNGSLGWHPRASVGADRIALHLTALALVASLGALGLRTLAESASALQLLAAKPLRVMVAVLALAGCLAGAEDASRTLSHTTRGGAQAWTDEALLQLPSRALVLTYSEEVGKRLLTAQARGARPDVLIVPLASLSDGRQLSHWLEKEPAMGVLLRDLSVSTHPSERAISHLVDVRPVFLEPNDQWDRRILEHVVPGLPLSRLAPHAVARSDRLAALEDTPPKSQRITTAATLGLVEDRRTLRVFEDNLEGLARSLKKIGDRASQRRLEELFAEPEPADPDATAQDPPAPLAQRR